MNKIWLALTTLALIGASVAVARTRDHEATLVGRLPCRAAGASLARPGPTPANVPAVNTEFARPFSAVEEPDAVCAVPAYSRELPLVGSPAGFSRRPPLLGPAALGLAITPR